jgi:hypothetical protein
LTAPASDFAAPAPYRWFRYHALMTNAAMHQINEIELFGIATVVIKQFGVDKALIPPGQPITLSWEVDPRTTNITISGVGNVTAQTVNGVGSVTLTPGPGSTAYLHDVGDASRYDRAANRHGNGN